ncbi:hypothetical protein FB107DRAFT_217136 [Schizophyllum commune]
MASTKAQSTVPTATTFCFKAPYTPGSVTTPNSPATKTRRVSLALPSSPKEFQAWSFRDDTGVGARSGQSGEEHSGMHEKRGKMRKLADGDAATEKKQRKRWTPEETQMLVEGCNRHGVGNWKAILSDPTLTFDNRSPVDLKDRFRTYFPDAYKKHYPNAKTHLSSKVRSTLPDGSSLFEKTRSKKRRPFTEEEDRALKAGYEKHGTVWATIVKDPVFQEQNRRSTDLRDRFRNAYPELYEAAGYKPRNASTRRRPQAGDPIRAATDDQLAMSSTGPTRRRRRAHTSQGFLRGGTKSVPQSNANSEDEASDDEDTVFKRPQTPVFSPPEAASTPSTSSVIVASPSAAEPPPVSEDEEMNLLGPDLLAEPDSLLNFLTLPDAPTQTWSAPGTHTPTHSSQGWAAAMGSPTSPDMSASLYGSQSSDTFGGYGGGMIGKSAWGTQDWFSPNPRMDPESSASTSSSYYDSSGISSFSSPVSHGVMDRLDLFPTSLSTDFSSDIGFGETHSTFSDELFHPAGFRGFTHHSDTAGDLIFGARTHQSQPLGSALGLSEPLAPTTGIHPSQLHTPALANIDEVENIEISCMNLNDPVGSTIDQPMADATLTQSVPASSQQQTERINLEDYVDLSAHEVHNSPPSTPVTRYRPLRPAAVDGGMSSHGRSISVPPARYAPVNGRPPTAHANSQPELGQRRMSFYDLASPPSYPGQLPYAAPPMAPSASLPVTAIVSGQMGPPPMSPPGPISQGIATSTMSSPPPPPPFTGFASFSDPYIQSSDPMDLAFLDLHHYGVPDGASMEWDTDRQGQALDLAEPVRKPPTPPLRAMSPFRSTMSPTKRAPIPAAFREAASSSAPGRGVERSISASRVGHQRGQSAATAHDLDMTIRDTNKRKRASWDGRTY